MVSTGFVVGHRIKRRVSETSVENREGSLIESDAGELGGVCGGYSYHQHHQHMWDSRWEKTLQM